MCCRRRQVEDHFLGAANTTAAAAASGWSTAGLLAHTRRDSHAAAQLGVPRIDDFIAATTKAYVFSCQSNAGVAGPRHRFLKPVLGARIALEMHVMVERLIVENARMRVLFRRSGEHGDKRAGEHRGEPVERVLLAK